MKLKLQGVRLPLAHFALELEFEIVPVNGISIEVRQLRHEFSIPFLVVSHSHNELRSLCEILVEIGAGKILRIYRSDESG
jgi:ABC-type molybdate transport system ATPase subunit